MPFRSLRRKLFLGLSAATLLFGVAMVVFAQTFVRNSLVETLQDKGVAIARVLAADAVNPVITGKHLEIALELNDLKAADPEIAYAFVADEEGADVAGTFVGAIPVGLKGANRVNPARSHAVRELDTERGPVLDVGVPLLHGQIGELHLGLSLVPIRAAVNRIVWAILAFAAASVVLGAGAAVGFSTILTRPLHKLAGVAERFGRGEAAQPLPVESDDEIGTLAQVFNEMMAKRMQAAEEQAELIDELRTALGEVKTLRGFLPICSGCKKIRSDQGYWQQIESYLSEHSDAEVSHGLCPECAARLYPEIWVSVQKKGKA